MKTYLNDKSNLVLTTTAVLTFLFLLTTGYFISQQSRIIVQKRTKLQELRRDVNRLDQAKADYDLHQNTILSVTSTVPSNYQEVAHAINQIELAASNSQQSLETTVTEAAQSESGGLSSVTLTLSTSGSFSGLSQMLTDIASLPYHTHVDSLQIDADGGSTTALINMRLFIWEK
jgi:Tfp pilus assembly protein PilO